MEENKIDNFINNLLQDREISGNSSRWANWKSMLTLFTCKYCVEHHGMIVDISILDYKLESHVIIHFDDSGDGVAQGKEKDIFRPFETSKEDGIGLGLNIVKDIVEKYHGEITVKRSETLHGAKFVVTLPKGES